MFSKEVRPSKLAFERKEKSPGQSNPKYVDLLEVDKGIAGQNFCCISFVSPEKILKGLYSYYYYFQLIHFHPNHNYNSVSL